MRPRSLFGRLVLILVLGLVLAQALGLAIHHFDRERMFLKSNAAQTAQRISDIVSLLDTLEPSGREKVIAILNTRRWSASLSGTPLPLSTTPRDSGLTEFERAVKPLLSSRQHGVGMQQGTYSVSAQLAGGGWVTLGYRRDAVIVPNVLLWTWLALAIVIVIVTLVAARSVTKPLSVLANAAEALGRDIERPPLSETGPSEVKRAAHAFNTMQKRIRRFIADRARTFTAMSHDLKTPITRMRLRAEMLESPALKAKFTADLDEMQSMVDSSLAFMRGIEDEASKKVDVGALLESLKYDHEEIGHSVVIEGRALAPYYGKPLALKRLLNNLISNAVQYGGMATVVVADDSQELQILVCDCGPGIPEADLERVFEPFYRLETSRNRSSGGTGLGLSIGRDIARLHGGDIVLGNLPDGGLEATLTLPRYAQTQSMTSDFASGRKNHAPSPSPTPSPPSTPLRAGLEGNVGAVPAKAERWARPGVLESGARPGVLESGGDGAAGRKKR